MSDQIKRVVPAYWDKRRIDGLKKRLFQTDNSCIDKIIKALNLPTSTQMNMLCNGIKQHRLIH